MKTLSRTVLVPLAAVVVLALLWMSFGHRRAYAQDPVTLNFISPTVDSSTAQAFTINVYNHTTGAGSGTVSIDNENGTAQTPPTSFTVASRENYQFQYKPPVGTVVLWGSTLPVVVGEPFVPSVSVSLTPGTSGDVCVNIEGRDGTTGAVAWIDSFLTRNHMIFDLGPGDHITHDIWDYVECGGIPAH